MSWSSAAINRYRLQNLQNEVGIQYINIGIGPESRVINNKCIFFNLQLRKSWTQFALHTQRHGQMLYDITKSWIRC